MLNSRILYDDYYIIAVNKPAGLMTEKDRFENPSLEEEVENYINAAHVKRKKNYLGIIHRLDRNASGIIIFAKTPGALKNMQMQFENRKIKKIYRAVLENIPVKKQGILQHWLFKDVKNKKAIISDSISEKYKNVELKYKVLQEKENMCFAEIELITGRYHQIRAQMAYAGCAILNDEKYGAALLEKNPIIYLHAWSLLLYHPKTNQKLLITAPIPGIGYWNVFNTN